MHQLLVSTRYWSQWLYHIHDQMTIIDKKKRYDSYFKLIIFSDKPFRTLSYSNQNQQNKIDIFFIFEFQCRCHIYNNKYLHTRKIFQLPQILCQQHQKWLSTIHLVRMVSSDVWRAVAMVTSLRLQKMAAVPAASVSHVGFNV